MGGMLVTGATGFVGSRLCRMLADQGREVHVVARPTSDTQALAPVLDRLTVHVHDSDTLGLAAILDKAGPDTVCHLASLFIAEHAPGDVDSLIASNVLFGAQLLEAMSMAGCRRLINAGTTWQHYLDRDYSPTSLYAATKQAFEDLVAFYVEAWGLSALTLVLPDTYGAGDPRRKLFWVLDRAAASGRPLDMSPGEQIIDLVYVEDVCRAVAVAERRLADTAPGHERCVLSSGEARPLREVVDMYARALGRPVPVNWGGRAYRAREMMTPWSGGQALPGWSPGISLARGLEELAAGFAPGPEGEA